MSLKGSCGCENVKYTIKDKPLFTQACHCNNCKKSTGSSFVIHTMIFEDDFIVNGKVSSTELPTGSGKGYRAFFCEICGVYLYCKYNVALGRVAIRTKTLNNPLRPQAHIFVKDKDPWIEIENKDKKPKGYFTNISEIEQAIESGNISLHSDIICRYETIDEKENKIFEKHRSTAGRFILSSILPKNHKIKFSLVDRILSKKHISEIIDLVFRHCGQKETVIFCDKLKALGFKL